MRRLNLKFLAGLLGVSLALVVGGYLLHRLNVGRSAEISLGKAEDAYKTMNLRSAVSFYANYLQQNPNDDARRKRQALIAAEQTKRSDAQRSDIQLAYRLLEQALRTKSLRDDYDLRRQLIDLQVKVGLFNEARKNIDVLSAAGRSDPELEFLSARCAYASNLSDLALEKLTKLIGYDSVKKKFDARQATAPENLDAYALLAVILRDRKESPQEADLVVDRMVTANPKSPLALVRRCIYLMHYRGDGTLGDAKARMNRAKEDLRKALVIDPNNVGVLLQNAVLASMDKDPAAAQKHLEHALSIDPTDERIYLHLAMLLFNEKHQKEAVECIKKGLEKLPTSQNLVLALFDYQIQMRDVEAARQGIARMVQAQVMPEKVALAKARLAMLEQKWLEAARALEALRPKLRSNPTLTNTANLLLGQCYGMLHQPDRQLEADSNILQNNPQSVEALQGKANALQNQGRLEEALDIYRQDLARVMSPAAFAGNKRLLTSYYGIVEALLRRDPKNARYMELSQQIRQQMESLENGPSISASDVDLMKISELMRQRRFDDAATLLQREIAKNPRNVRLRIAMILIVADRQGNAAGLARAAEVEKELGDSIELRKLRGELLMRQGGPKTEQNIAALEQGIEKFSPEGQSDLWSQLGEWYFRLAPTERERVKRCWERALTLNPNNASLMERLFELARESDDNPAMLKARDEFERAFGRESSQWRFAEAARLVAQVRGHKRDAAALDEARKLTEQIAEQRPDWYMLSRLQGEISELQGDSDGALRAFQRSLEIGPPNPQVAAKVIEMLFARRQFKDADKVIQRLGSSAVGMEKAEALIKVATGEKDAALSAIELAMPDDSKQPADLLLKGQLLLRIGKQDLAEGALRKAVDLGPDLPQCWLALVECLARDGKPQEAESVIRRAENKLSEDQASLVLANCYKLLGMNDQAEQYFLTALRDRPGDLALLRDVASFYLDTRQVDKAAPHLAAILRAAPQISREDMQHLVWARREMAKLMVHTEMYPQFQLAIKLVESNASSGKIQPDDAVLLAQLYNTRRDTASLRQAQQLLEQVQNKVALNYDARLTLAEVYFKVNQWDKCRSLLTDLMASNPEDPRALIMLAEALLKRNEPELAASWVRKLALSQPKSADTIRLSALLAARRNRPDEAVAVIDASLPEKFDAENAPRLFDAARMLENLALYPAAEKRYRQLAQFVPQGKLALAAYLARRGRVDEAFSLMEPEISATSLAEICEIGTTALRAARESGHAIPPRQRDRLLSWYDQALSQNPNALALFSEEAGLKDLLGDREGAEQIYRKLVNDPQAPLGQRAINANNLAFILAMGNKNLDEAQQLIQFSIAQLGPLPELLDTRALVSIARGNPQDAIRDLSEATEFGGPPEMFFHLALAQKKANDRASASQSLRRAREQGLRKEKLSSFEVRELDKLNTWLTS